MFRRLRDAYEVRGEEGHPARSAGEDGVSSARVRDGGRRSGWLEMFRTRSFRPHGQHLHERVVRQPMADGKLFHCSEQPA